MSTSTKNDAPKKRGRPPTGKHPIIGFRSPPGLTARIDEFAEGRGLPRAAAIRRLVEQGLSDRIDVIVEAYRTFDETAARELAEALGVDWSAIEKALSHPPLG